MLNEQELKSLRANIESWDNPSSSAAMLRKAAILTCIDECLVSRPLLAKLPLMARIKNAIITRVEGRWQDKAPGMGSSGL